MAETPAPDSPSDLAKLLELVARLRAPDGCPWDREQHLPDVRAYLLEEAHELAAAIDTGDPAELRGELGDLLFQAAFVARLAEEAGWFTAAQAIDGVHGKMVARHPHVFGDETAADADAVRQAWERRKLREEPGRASLLAGVPVSLPALLGAYRLTQKAAGVGFDWPDAASVFAKIEEEIAELREAAGRGGPGGKGDRAAMQEEIGDLLFTVANLARKWDLDPEAALAATNRKFRYRFGKVEEGLAARDKSPADATLEEMDALWEAAKRAP
jgi:ATP diphosphatase